MNREPISAMGSVIWKIRYFRGLYDWACLGTGGTIEAARLVTEEGYDVAFNLAGGWHHAHRSKSFRLLLSER